MLVRIVHMYFTIDGAEKFLEIFIENAAAIRQMDGCSHLELLRDIEDGTHFTTLSHWDSKQYLQSYRNSTLFSHVWSRVKPCFAARPLAHSFELVPGQSPP